MQMVGLVSCPLLCFVKRMRKISSAQVATFWIMPRRSSLAVARFTDLDPKVSAIKNSVAWKHSEMAWLSARSSRLSAAEAAQTLKQELRRREGTALREPGKILDAKLAGSLMTG
jgi:hypothetical protein